MQADDSSQADLDEQALKLRRWNTWKHLSNNAVPALRKKELLGRRWFSERAFDIHLNVQRCHHRRRLLLLETKVWNWETVVDVRGHSGVRLSVKGSQSQMSEEAKATIRRRSLPVISVCRLQFKFNIDAEVNSAKLDSFFVGHESLHKEET
jgi:hypothetical protein